jgi:hypothetical protein
LNDNRGMVHLAHSICQCMQIIALSTRGYGVN